CFCCFRGSASSCTLNLFLRAMATTEIYTLSLHDALPILTHAEMVRLLVGRNMLFEERAIRLSLLSNNPAFPNFPPVGVAPFCAVDRKSTRLNSSHVKISYAVFCLKKKTHIRHWYHSTAL